MKPLHYLWNIVKQYNQLALLFIVFAYGDHSNNLSSFKQESKRYYIISAIEQVGNIGLIPKEIEYSNQKLVEHISTDFPVIFFQKSTAFAISQEITIKKKAVIGNQTKKLLTSLIFPFHFHT